MKAIAAPAANAARLRRLQGVLVKTGMFLFSITLFILALLLMKEGAHPMAPLVRDKFSVDSPASAIGFGWLSASLALSGSPVAATSLTFLEAGVLSPTEAYAMVAGSRLGAAFVVLLIGFIYTLRGKKREISLGVGLLSLLVTQTMYVAVLPLGFFLLSQGWVQDWQIQTSKEISSPFELVFDPIVSTIKNLLPANVLWILFPIGFVLMLTSLSLVDKALPDFHLQESKVGRVNRLLYRPIVGFALGAGITSLTMSVSVSLSLLVPLSVRGYIRRENVIPYILGANITTFIDTLIAAALLANPAAVTVVLVQMISVSIISFLLLLINFRLYERALEWLASFIGAHRFRLALYILAILGIPFALLIFA